MESPARSFLQFQPVSMSWLLHLEVPLPWPSAQAVSASGGLPAPDQPPNLSQSELPKMGLGFPPLPCSIGALLLLPPATREGLLFRLQTLADHFQSSECRQNRLYPRLQSIPTRCPPEMPAPCLAPSRWHHICVYCYPLHLWVRCPFL